ncbi:phage DNA ejection protein [Yersinia ruckeri]|uniref:phage DNA ejection protein n=1 Tax=Yersinia ruckeri TaxID=29486 RepID=UPI0008FEA47B|nr:phage DNA ejection protein [Yersinia ruckeri]OJB95798.1 DNA transfer protein [Yersinia ruckeri]OJB98599.1 DNA transfer protein [Yersinia ruckeri]OJC00247.1 DNA transfer protein [Yersinia ruckeri]
MATWDQGNSGGLLAGIGNNNVNAPQSSDANTALGLIRQNNEDERSGRNNVGLQTLQGISSVAQSYQQAQQEQRKQEFQKAYAGAYSSGDRNAMRQLASQYPDQFEAVRSGMGFIDEDQRNTVGSLASTARLAAQSPETMGQWLKSNASELARVGVNPGDVATMYQQNPQGFGEFADHLGMSAIGPEKYFDLQDKAVGREIDRGKLAETVRSNQAGESLQGQQIAVSRENSIRSANAPTAAMQNYQQYAQLLKADPSSAATFAQAAGINPADKKLFKVETLPDGSLMKFYSDGTEEMAKSGDPIGQPGIKPISLPAAQNIIDKANEGSKKAAGFALRLKDSMDAMNNLSGTIDPKRIALINNALGNGTVANMSLSPAEQQYMVNARDALYSILRPETGAAITEGEMKEYSKMYLPQPGDSSKATETKMKKMNGQYKSLRGQSGRVYDALVVSSAANEGGGSPAMNQQPTTQQPTSGGGFSNLWGG